MLVECLVSVLAPIPLLQQNFSNAQLHFLPRGEGGPPVVRYGISPNLFWEKSGGIWRNWEKMIEIDLAFWLGRTKREK